MCVSHSLFHCPPASHTHPRTRSRRMQKNGSINHKNPPFFHAYRRGTRVWCGGFRSLGNSVCQSRKDPPPSFNTFTVIRVNSEVERESVKDVTALFRTRTCHHSSLLERNPHERTNVRNLKREEWTTFRIFQPPPFSIHSLSSFPFLRLTRECRRNDCEERLTVSRGREGKW